jgi:hypothetical protein
MRHCPIQRSTGNAKVIALAAVAALGLAAKAALNAYDSGARDPSFIICMSLALVVAIAIVAPGKFLRPGAEEDDWGDNVHPYGDQRETPMPPPVDVPKGPHEPDSKG